jgi:RNA polymerase sigma-70 factor (ECF subfamily)
VTPQFEEHRDHLRGVAYRMLGSPSEADDAVQETWLRFHRAAPDDVANLRGWLTTVVARICLDMLRARTARREDPLVPENARETLAAATAPDAEHERALADSVGLALLVVLDRLDPAERIAFVMHDLLAIPFEEIAPIVGRSPEATRQLASRARRRVHGAPPPEAELARQRTVVDAFIAALRRGDVDALIALMDPEVEVSVDGGRRKLAARAWASGAVAFARAMRFASAALVDGGVALLMAPHGRLGRVLRFTFAEDRIAGAEVIAERDRLEALDIAVLE